MPGLHDCLILAKSMRENVPLPGSISFYLDNSDDSSLSAFGYFGKIYLDHEHKEIMFVHRSTTVDGQIQTHENSSIVGSSNLANDSSIYFQVLPRETVIALRFVTQHCQKLMKTYPTYSCVHIGHSLGGFHAHYCGYSLKHRVIAIDPPGAKEVIMREFFPLEQAQCENHISVFIKRNLINETNRHLGRLAYCLYDVEWSGQVGVEESINTLKTHSLELFMEHISATALDPKDELPMNFSWYQPKVIASSSTFYANTQNTTPSTSGKCFIL